MHHVNQFERRYSDIRRSPSIIGEIINSSLVLMPAVRDTKWHNTKHKRPELGEELSVRVVAMYRGQLVTGCYTCPKGYSYDTFVFNHVLLRECIPDVTAWMYRSDLDADITACLPNSNLGCRGFYEALNNLDLP